MSVNEKAAEILENAADGFESGRYYWTKGQFRRMVFGNASYCSVGALAHEADLTIRGAYHLDPVRPDAFDVAVGAMARQINPDWSIDSQHVVVNWNDRNAAKGEVIDVMKHAAKDLRNQT